MRNQNLFKQLYKYHCECENIFTNLISFKKFPKLRIPSFVSITVKKKQQKNSVPTLQVITAKVLKKYKVVLLRSTGDMYDKLLKFIQYFKKINTIK